MQKIARVLLNRNMLILYIVNFLLADPAIYVFFLVMVAAFLGKYNYFILAIIISVGRLFILPNFYNWFAEFAKDKYIQDFLYGLQRERTGEGSNLAGGGTGGRDRGSGRGHEKV